MPRDYKLYLEDMLDAIKKIEEYVQGFTFQEFCESDLQVDAVLYNLEIVGEAVKHIPESVTAKHPSVEWRKIAGLRDIIAHEYFGISLEIIWDVLENKLPDLRVQIATLLEEEQ
jgi:uncharacterized protein with HEPN domain